MMPSEFATSAICPRTRSGEMTHLRGWLAPRSSRSLFVSRGGSSDREATVGPDARPAKTPPTVGRIGTGPIVAKPEESGSQSSLMLSHGQAQDLVQQEATSRRGGDGLLGVILALNGVGEPVKLEDLECDPYFRSPRILAVSDSELADFERVRVGSNAWRERSG